MLLHVEVHEGRSARRRGSHRGALIQDPEALGDTGQGVLEGPHVELAGDGRDLDRDVVHLGIVDEGQGSLESSGRLVVAQHGLAQQVDVHGVALGPTLSQVLVDRTRRRIDHHVADQLAQATTSQRHHETR